MGYKLLEKQITATSRGMLSKAWYVDDCGRKYLAKGNSIDGVRQGYEPFSEVIAYRVAKLLNLDAVEYVLAPKTMCPDVNTYVNMDFVSVCREFPITGQRLTFDTLMLINCMMETDSFYAYMKLNLPIDYLCRLLTFDAFIGNADRHTNNIEFFYRNGSYIGTPIFDNGASLLAWCDSRYVQSIKKGTKIYMDSSKPFKRTHTEQIKLLKRYFHYDSLFHVENKDLFFDMLFSSCSDVFSKMPSYRVNGIKNYLYNRRHFLD